MLIPKISELIKSKNLYDTYETATPSGVNSVVFLIDDNFVLKQSYADDDAFRFLAEQTEKRREKMSLPKIYEKKKSGCCMFYLIERLFPVDLSEEEICFFNKLNNNKEKVNIQKLSGKMNEIYDMIKKLDHTLFSLKDVVFYYPDFKEEHIMQNKEGRLFFIDPVAEIQLKEDLKFEKENFVIYNCGG